MNYGQLKTTVMDYSHRHDLAGMVPGFIRLAEGMIARGLRSAEQVATYTLTDAERMIPDGGIYDLPAGTLEVRSVFYGDAGRPVALEQIGIHQIRARSGSSRVRQFAVRGGQIEFRGIPPAGAELDLEYLTRLVALSADTDTNELLANHEALYIEGALAYLYKYTQDLELMTTAFDAFNHALENLNEQAGRKHGGASVAGAYNLFGSGGGY